MIGIFISLGLLGTLIWSFFDPLWASRVFLFGFILIFEGYIYLMSRAGRPDNLDAFSEPFFFNPEEVAAVKKYHLFFKFPFASREFSGAISGIQLSSFIWVPWLLYSGLWVTAIAIGINYFIAGWLAMQLNPRLFLQQGVNGPAGFLAITELQAIDSAFEKLQNFTHENKNAT